jgi:hypothetical protein
MGLRYLGSMVAWEISDFPVKRRCLGKYKYLSRIASPKADMAK